MKVQTSLLPHWQAVWIRSQDASGHLLGRVPGGQPAIAWRGKCLSVHPDPPACPHPLLHSECTPHTADLTSTDSSSSGDLKRTWGQLNFEDENYCGKRVNTDLLSMICFSTMYRIKRSVIWSRNLELWWKVIVQASAYGVDGLCKNFFIFTTISQVLKPDVWQGFWILMGLMAGNMERIRC